jgi:hypothetical protein
LTFVRDRGASFARNRTGAYEGWVRLYRNAARTPVEERLNAIADLPTMIGPQIPPQFRSASRSAIDRPPAVR